MGVSESTHSEAENLKSSFVSMPAVGEAANKPGCGGLLVVIVMEDSELVEDPMMLVVAYSVLGCLSYLLFFLLVVRFHTFFFIR